VFLRDGRIIDTSAPLAGADSLLEGAGS
jgi:hypothetical protein